jgi:hypothetical protein
MQAGVCIQFQRTPERGVVEMVLLAPSGRQAEACRRYGAAEESRICA